MKKLDNEALIAAKKTKGKHNVIVLIQLKTKEKLYYKTY